MSSSASRFAWPYRRPVESPFGPVSQWSAAYGSMSPEPLLAEMPGWDAGSQCTCIRTVSVDPDAWKRNCGLDPQHSVLHIAVTAETANGRLQELVWQREIGADTQNPVKIHLEFGTPDAPGFFGPGVLSGDLTLRTGVYLSEGGPEPKPLAAHRPGSILWSDSHRINLEEPESAVPIMPVSFKKGFMGITASAADFYVALEAIRDAGSLFRSSVMIYANVDTGFDHRLALLEPEAMSLVYAGLVTQLCMHLLLNDMLADSETPYEQGTVGSVAEGVLHGSFPGQSLAGISQIIRTRPAEYMVRMQDSAVRTTRELFK